MQETYTQLESRQRVLVGFGVYHWTDAAGRPLCNSLDELKTVLYSDKQESTLCTRCASVVERMKEGW